MFDRNANGFALLRTVIFCGMLIAIALYLAPLIQLIRPIACP